MSVLASVHSEILTRRVARVTDDNTIIVFDVDKLQHKKRLQRIDAPEREQAFDMKSKKHLSDLVAGKNVAVDYRNYDLYQRIPAFSRRILRIDLTVLRTRRLAILQPN